MLLCEIVVLTSFLCFQIIFDVPFVANALANVFLGAGYSVVVKFFLRFEGLALTSPVLNDMPLCEIVVLTCFSFFRIIFDVPFVADPLTNGFLGGYSVVVNFFLRSAEVLASASPVFNGMPLCEIVVFTCLLFFQIIFDIPSVANSLSNFFLGGYSVIVKFFLRFEGLASTSPGFTGMSLCGIVVFLLVQIIFDVPFVANSLADVFLGG